MRVLIDTCVVIDALQNRFEFAKDAEQIFLLAASNQIRGCITAKSVADIYYIMHRYNHSDDVCRTVLRKLFNLFEVINTTGEDCKNALSSSISDYEDAIMIATAVRTDVNCIITRNITDYKLSPVKVMSPCTFLSSI